MMDGNEAPGLCSKSVGWLQKQDKNVQPWLWKLSNCFSTIGPAYSTGGNPKDYMEHPKSTVELKDVPPPLPPFKSCKSTFPTVPLPKIQPPLLPPIQHQTGPKVSCCALCSNSSSGGGGFIHPNTILDTKVTGTVTCQVAPGLTFAPESHLKKNPSVSTFSPHSTGFTNLCVENRLSPCQFYSPQPVPCCSKVHVNTFHGDLPTLQVPSYGTSTSYITSGLSHYQNRLSQSEYLSHFCTSSLHLNNPHSLFLKGPHFCDSCIEKPSSTGIADANKIWPNIPPPTAQNAVPICNGCGTQETVKEAALLLAKNLCKASQKYGSPDLAAAGQIQENLPPIGVFWDIENCSVPSGRSAVTVVKRIRERLFKGRREAEFICVCDISKENKEVIEELNNCQPREVREATSAVEQSHYDNWRIETGTL